MTKRDIWERYAFAWKTEGRQSKLAALEESAGANCVYRAPGALARGREELVDEMLRFHQQVPGGYFTTVEFMEHNDRSMAKWNLLDGTGAIAGDGISFGEYDAEGKLVAMTGFFKTPED